MTTSKGDARNIEEYVPKNSPTVRTRAKFFVEAGPKKYKESKTRITVKEVLIDLVKVWLKLMPTVFSKSFDV